MNSALSLISFVKHTFVTNSFRAERQKEIITQLKFISTFEEGEKIDVKNLKVEQKNIFTPFKRLILGESRDTTYNFLSQTIERGFEILMSNIHSDKKSDKLFCKNMIKDLIAAKTGLTNIQQTYRDDKLFRCNIETLIESVDTKISEVKEVCPSLFTENEENLKENILDTKQTITIKNEKKIK